MLLRLRLANFRSLRDEQELSMIASALGGSQESLVHLEDLDLDLLRVAAIYGANAAGKSNVLAGLFFLRRAILESHRLWTPQGPLPCEAFRLDPARRAEPSSFEVDFLLDGVRYRYGFELDPERVHREWLYAYPHKRPQLWFERNPGATEPFTFGKHLKGNNRTIGALTRANSLFLSVAAENAHPMLLPIYLWFAQKVRFSTTENRNARMAFTVSMVENEESRTAVLDLLRLADLGIVGLEMRDRALGGIPSGLFSSGQFNTMLREAEPERSLELKHSSQADPAGVGLPLEEESRGTQAWLSLAGPLLHTLAEGAVLCVDELDASLHPRLALELVRIFDDPERNPRNAQLIFNTHDTTLLGNLLGDSGLRRDQVWFVEKDDRGATHLYPLTDFKPRKDENLERGYLQGRYGAVPFIVSAASLGDA